jgi:hypothetical protein
MRGGQRYASRKLGPYSRRQLGELDARLLEGRREKLLTAELVEHVGAARRTRCSAT